MKMSPTIVIATLAVVLLFLAAGSPTAQDDAGTSTTGEENAPVDYLIIAADGLREVAGEWAEYRASHGRVTRVLTMSAIARMAERKVAGLNDIKARIQAEAGGDDPREGFQVLLLGDCPDENAQGHDPEVEIPWQLTRHKDANQTESRRSRIPTDNYFADVVEGDKELPEIAVGRIPARTVEEARLALAKVKAYEVAPEGKWMRNLTFFAGEGRFGANIDSLLERLFVQFAEDVIDQGYAVRMTYANINSEYAYVPRRFSDKVIEEANRGALMLTYLGHGLHDRLDNMYIEVDGKRRRYPILTSEDVSGFDIPEGKLPVMMIIACRTGAMDHADGSLSEKICLTDNAPVAVIASSRDCHPYSNIIFQSGVVREITDTRAPTLGQAFLKAKRELILGEDPDRGRLEMLASFILQKEDRDQLNRAHLGLYNLVGDPGLRMRYPSLDFDISVRDDATVEPGGVVHLVLTSEEELALSSREGENGKVELPTCRFWIEVRRAEIPGKLTDFSKTDLAGGDEKARAKAEDAIAANHATANDKTVAKLEAECVGTTKRQRIGEDGGTPEWIHELIYEGKIDPGLAPGDYILKVFARDFEGERCGFSAVKIKVNK